MAVRRPLAMSRSATLKVALTLLVLMAATLLRLAGSAYDRPFNYHPDEYLLARPAMNTVATGDLNPHTFMYPTLLVYSETAVVKVVHAVTHVALSVPAAPGYGGLPAYTDSEIDPSQFVYVEWGRNLVGLFGAMTVLVVLLAALAAGRRRPRAKTDPSEAATADQAHAYLDVQDGTQDRAWLAALAAAVFMALAVLPIDQSRFLTTDVPCAFFTAATLAVTVFAAARFPGRSSDRLMIAACLLAGLAASTKYNAGTVAMVPAIAYLIRAGSPRRIPGLLFGALRSPTPYLMVLAAVAGFILATPMVLFHPENVWQGLQFNITLYNFGGHVGHEGDPIRFYIDYLWTTGFGPVLSVLSVLGIGWALLRHRAADLLIVVFTLAYFGLASIPIVRYERNLMPLVPFVAVLAGRFVADAAYTLRRLMNRRSLRLANVVAAALLVMLLVQPAAAAVSDVQVHSLPDTRTVSLQWVDAHLPAGSTVVREAYTPQLSADQYRVGFIWTLSSYDLTWYRTHGFRYAITSSLMYYRYVGTQTAEGRFYSSLFSLPTVYRSDPSDSQQGPTILILDLGPIGSPG